MMKSQEASICTVLSADLKTSLDTPPAPPFSYCGLFLPSIPHYIDLPFLLSLLQPLTLSPSILVFRDLAASEECGCVILSNGYGKGFDRDDVLEE